MLKQIKKLFGKSAYFWESSRVSFRSIPTVTNLKEFDNKIEKLNMN